MKKTFYLIVLFLINCTGLNTGFLMYNFSNTNPTPVYAHELAMRFHGGFVYHNNTIPGQIGNAETDSKGKSCQMAVLYTVSWGDSSIEGAKKNGGITKVGAIDYQQFGILGGYLYHAFCTTVYGSKDSMPAQKEADREPIIPAKTPAKKGK
jgi:hypothetical protein